MCPGITHKNYGHLIEMTFMNYDELRNKSWGLLGQFGEICRRQSNNSQECKRALGTNEQH